MENNQGGDKSAGTGMALRDGEILVSGDRSAAYARLSDRSEWRFLFTDAVLPTYRATDSTKGAMITRVERVEFGGSVLDIVARMGRQRHLPATQLEGARYFLHCCEHPQDRPEGLVVFPGALLFSLPGGHAGHAGMQEDRLFLCRAIGYEAGTGLLFVRPG